MSTPDAPTTLARAARAVAARSCTLASALAGLASAALPQAEMRAAAETSIEAVAREPRYGAALARLAHTLAQSRADPELLAHCAVARLRVENFLGNCAEAVQLGAALPALAAVQAERALRWRVWLELAMAWRQLGEMDHARHALDEARAAHAPAAGEETAWLAWAAGKMAMRETQYSQAQTLLAEAELQFRRLGLGSEAERCRRASAEALAYQAAATAQTVLAQVRTVFEAGALPFDVVQTDALIALTYMDVSNRYTDALAIQRASAAAFDDFDAPFYAASSRAEVGLLLLLLNRYDEAAGELDAARNQFSLLQAHSDVVRVNINLAVIHNLAQRPWQAVPLLEEAAEFSARRPGRLARCLGGLAQSYQLLGRYDRSLDFSRRALVLFAQQGITNMYAECAEVLAGTLLRLGQHVEAELYLTQARDYYEQHDLPLNRVRCDMHLAELLLAQSRRSEARTVLESARAVCAAHGLRVNAAECERLLAELAVREGRLAEADELLAAALATYESESLPAPAALCGLSAARLAIARGQIEAAELQLRGVCETLRDVRPDALWQAHRALAECALRRHAPAQALAEYRAALAIVQQMRAPLPSERLSASFFSERSALFHDAFRLAMEQQQWADALAVSEAAQTTTFTLFLQSRGRALSQPVQGDPYIARLLERQAALRRTLSQLHQQIDIASPLSPTALPEPLLRGGRPLPPLEMLLSVKALQAEHDEVVEQLRLAIHVERVAPAPFALAELRRLLNARFAERWLCLVYHQSGAELTVFALSAQDLSATPLHPSRLQRIALAQATAQDPDMRELVYRGTLGGVAANPSLGRNHLRALFELLIPPAVRARLSTLDHVWIVPTGALHRLPFQALLNGERCLIEHAPLAYAPSLHALQLLLAAAPPAGAPDAVPNSALLVGLADFAGRARPLPGAEAELRGVAGLIGEPARLLWGAAATPGALRGLSTDGTLEHCRILHVASHGMVGQNSPLESRLLLHGGEFTTADVLDLRLNGALVTLSACETAAGEAGPGDELLNLARVFFYAGAQALIASAWAVEDEPAQRLMHAFYGRLLSGDSPARALQQAQCALAHAGLTPYQWAAFQLMGAA